MQIFKITIAVLATTFVASCASSSPETQSGKASQSETYGKVASYGLSDKEKDLMQATTMSSFTHLQFSFREASKKKLEISRENYEYENGELLPQSQSVLYCTPQTEDNSCIFVYAEQPLNVTEMQCDPDCLSTLEEQRFGTTETRLSRQITSVIDARGITSSSTLIEDDDRGGGPNGVAQEPPVTFEEGQPLIVAIAREKVAGEPQGGSLILPPLPITMTEQDLLDELEDWEEYVRSEENTFEGTLTLVLMRISDVSAGEPAQ
jgi:hypothetical protein